MTNQASWATVPGMAQGNLQPVQRTRPNWSKSIAKVLETLAVALAIILTSALIVGALLVPINGSNLPQHGGNLMSNFAAAAGGFIDNLGDDDGKSAILDGCKPGTRTDNDRDGDCWDNSIDQCPDYANADSNGNIFLCPVDASPEPGNPNGECAGAPALAIHQQFLAELDPYFHNDGWKAWFDAAGFTADAVKFQARQPEEDSLDLDGDRIVDVNYVAGLQVDGKNIVVIWPNVVTTNDPGRITKKLKGYHEHLVDSDGQGSTQYTNVIAKGEVTVWASGFSWSELSTPFACVQPEIGNVHANSGMTGAATGPDPDPVDPGTTGSEDPEDVCLTTDDLAALTNTPEDKINWQYNEGDLAGAQLRLNQRYSALPGWTMHLNTASVASANKGQTVTLWSPESCRPLS